MKIGLMLPLGEDDGLARAHSWPEIRELAMEAERSGLDSIAAPDHLVFHSSDGVHGIREAWTLLSALSAITNRVEIVPLVLAVPFRNPALTAKMAAELDAISDGRRVRALPQPRPIRRRGATRVRHARNRGGGWGNARGISPA